MYFFSSVTFISLTNLNELIWFSLILVLIACCYSNIAQMMNFLY